VRTSLRSRAAKDARVTDPCLEQDEDEPEHMNQSHANETQTDITNPPLAQARNVVSTQSFTVPIENDPALHVELTINEFIKMSDFPKKLFLIDGKLRKYTAILHFYSSERIFTQEAALKNVNNLICFFFNFIYIICFVIDTRFFSLVKSAKKKLRLPSQSLQI